MSDAWPDGAVDYVQAITDTKLVLSHRYSSRMFSGATMEDRSADATAAQEELGHVRQLFNLLEDQGRDEAWLQGDRERSEYANAPVLDEPGERWLQSTIRTGLADRATWLLLDAVDHPDFAGMVQKIGEEEYFHLEHQDGRILEHAETEPAVVQETFESAMPAALTYLGPAAYTAEDDPLYAAGFTNTPISDLREGLRRHYEALLSETSVTVAELGAETPAVENWNERRRRADDGGIDEGTAASLQWARGTEVPKA